MCEYHGGIPGGTSVVQVGECGTSGTSGSTTVVLVVSVVLPEWYWWYWWYNCLNYVIVTQFTVLDISAARNSVVM
jgi:hypothetical protein